MDWWGKGWVIWPLFVLNVALGYFNLHVAFAAVNDPVVGRGMFAMSAALCAFACVVLSSAHNR